MTPDTLDTLLTLAVYACLTVAGLTLVVSLAYDAITGALDDWRTRRRLRRLRGGKR